MLGITAHARITCCRRMSSAVVCRCEQTSMHMKPMLEFL
eukprot:CAMPEP_0204053532 /NCGR_PEP_ID=MMETSP0360-20130528/126805_1 /ASSEMBLY_ACC=CAM_ASM_000342 /TAXON_ID=268821 /ORGANISM="Scrippsiella Hangoei, Strain SHTV-5" /LENGTH=38 /DNA_ID= /DNA_START= /DNA_END= /DNA_ORIENTATION=